MLKSHGLVGTVVGDVDRADDFLMELAALMTYFQIDLVDVGWSRFSKNENKSPKDQPEETA